MRATQAVQYLGQTGTINHAGLKIQVKVLDVKERWGYTRFLVEPIAGNGSAWFENVVITKKETEMTNEQ